MGERPFDPPADFTDVVEVAPKIDSDNLDSPLSTVENPVA
jgi:hypothetical protein